MKAMIRSIVVAQSAAGLPGGMLVPGRPLVIRCRKKASLAIPVVGVAGDG
jgi:hypothetical protein